VNNDVPTIDYRLIKTNQELNTCCQHWQSKAFLGMDTEFMRVNTFYPQLALIQVNDGDAIYLIDPLGISEWEAFAELMLSPGVVKIFHSCSEDLGVFVRHFGLLPTPLFDTQIANAFLNEGFGLSYQNLVAAQSGHELPKGETRSDWLQRPLTQQQLQYAALDVEYLPAIYLAQKEQLQEQGRLSWVEEDCQRLSGNYREELAQDFSQAYLGFSAAWQLNGEQLRLLKLLAEWREKRARQRDKPKNWIVQDKSILEIARYQPQALQELRAIDSLSVNFIRYEGEAILQLVRQAQDLPPLANDLPRPLSNAQKKLFKKAQALVRQKAESVGLPVEILGRKRLLLAVFNVWLASQSETQQAVDITSLTLPDELLGWRKAILLPVFQELFQ